MSPRISVLNKKAARALLRAALLCDCVWQPKEPTSSRTLNGTRLRMPALPLGLNPGGDEGALRWFDALRAITGLSWPPPLIGQSSGPRSAQIWVTYCG